jgi:hypothetical protein
MVKRKPQGIKRTRRCINPAVKTAAAKSTRSACADPGKDGGVKKTNTTESVDEMKNIKGAKDTKNFGNQGIDLKKRIETNHPGGERLVVGGWW